MAENKRGNFHGTLLVILMFIAIFALFTAKPETTGFVVQEISNSELNSNDDLGLSCAGKIGHGICSQTKPLFCDDGNLVYNCFECGCGEGETCTEFGTCGEIEKCADGSIYGECSTGLKGNFCNDGELKPNCELCGCEADELCNDNKCVSK